LTAPLIRPSDPHQRERIVVADSTASSADTHQSRLGGCDGATAGPDRWYELDLGAAVRAVEVRAILDAEFDAALALRRGACGDALSLDCDRGSALGRPSSMLAARLEPGVYWLVVDGNGVSDGGDFQLQVDLDPQGGVACERPPTNLGCESPVAFAGRDIETLIVDTDCRTVDPKTDDKELRSYSLDLSSESGPVLVTLSSWNFAAPRVGYYPDHLAVYPADGAGSTCGTRLAASTLSDGGESRMATVLRSLLAPGRYLITLRTEQLDANGEASPSALTLQLERGACRDGPVGNTCETALELPTDPGTVVRWGSTLCNQSHVTLADCGEANTPDQFYRLDLRAQAAPTRTRMSILVDGLEIQPLLYLLADDGAGGCGRGLYCNDTIANWEGAPHYELTLAPALYFIGVESAFAGLTGSYGLLVELSRAEPSPCVTTEIDQCAFHDYTTLCWDGWTPACLDAAVLCGLAAETRACVCETAPGCCEVGADPTRCSEVDAACGYFCPEFASSYTCLDRF
jgi:hypothetical protein